MSSTTSELTTVDNKWASHHSGGGIEITRYRSLEPPLSPAAPIARVCSGPPQDQDDSPMRVLNTFEGSGTADDPYLVDWEPGERANPYNWANWYRWTVTAIVALSTLCIAFASSAYSPSIGLVKERFQTNTNTAIAGLSLYVLGFGVGPLLWAPLSEIYGRNVAFLVSFPIFTVFNIVGAVAQNIETLLISRLIAGTFGAAPITNAGGQIGDMWAAHERALATSLFAMAPFLGPVIGPIVGGYVAEAKGFRWVFWVQFVFGLVMFLISLFVVPETYAPTLLRRKAKRLQKQADDVGTGEHFIAKYDKVKMTTLEVFKTNLIRPFELIAREVIVFCLGVYGAIVYGTLYLFFAGFPVIWTERRGWGLGQSGLAFIGLGIGLVIGNCCTPIWSKHYRRATLVAQRRGESHTPPEARLIPCAVGAVILPAAMLVFAWTSPPNIHWAVPMLFSVPFGAGFLFIFSGMQLYLIDAYQLYAASALASAAVMRAVFATVFPLFTRQMYHKLGLEWAGTLVAFLSLTCTPMPFLFYRYGAYLRRNSRYAPSNPEDGPSAHKVPQPKETEALEPEYGREAGEFAKELSRTRSIISATRYNLPEKPTLVFGHGAVKERSAV